MRIAADGDTIAVARGRAAGIAIAGAGVGGTLSVLVHAALEGVQAFIDKRVLTWRSAPKI